MLLLVRTSNPGAADIEDLELDGGGTVWERTAALVDELGAGGVGEAGISDVGAVVGATAPWHLGRARELMPRASFLLPGIGAQGGRVEELRPAFAPRPRRWPGVGLAQHRRRPPLGRGLSGRCRPAEAERLRRAAWELSAVR